MIAVSPFFFTAGWRAGLGRGNDCPAAKRDHGAYYKAVNITLGVAVYLGRQSLPADII